MVRFKSHLISHRETVTVLLQSVVMKTLRLSLIFKKEFLAKNLIAICFRVYLYTNISCHFRSIKPNATKISSLPPMRQHVYIYGNWVHINYQINVCLLVQENYSQIERRPITWYTWVFNFIFILFYHWFERNNWFRSYHVSPWP